MTSDNISTIAQLVPTKREADIAADLKDRLAKALEPVGVLMDEANAHGLMVQWDSFAPQPPYYKHKPNNLRLVKHY
jgi:hypothetical protein